MNSYKVIKSSAPAFLGRVFECESCSDITVEKIKQVLEREIWFLEITKIGDIVILRNSNYTLILQEVSN